MVCCLVKALASLHGKLQTYCMNQTTLWIFQLNTIMCTLPMHILKHYVKLVLLLWGWFSVITPPAARVHYLVMFRAPLRTTRQKHVSPSPIISLLYRLPSWYFSFCYVTFGWLNRGAEDSYHQERRKGGRREEGREKRSKKRTRKGVERGREREN